MERPTHLPIPPAVAADGVYAPLLALLRDTLLKPNQVAARWGQGEGHLAALRRTRRGLPFVRLPARTPTEDGKAAKGSIRYRLSDIIRAEIDGTCGPLTVERVCLAIASCPDVPKEARAKIQAHVRLALADAE